LRSVDQVVDGTAAVFGQLLKGRRHPGLCQQASCLSLLPSSREGVPARMKSKHQYGVFGVVMGHQREVCRASISAVREAGVSIL